LIWEVHNYYPEECILWEGMLSSVWQQNIDKGSDDYYKTGLIERVRHEGRNFRLQDDLLEAVFGPLEEKIRIL